MDAILSPLLSAVLAGGNSAIVSLLAFICYGLWVDRTRLLRQYEAAQERLDAVARAQTDSTAAIVAAIRQSGLSDRNGARGP